MDTDGQTDMGNYRAAIAANNSGTTYALAHIIGSVISQKFLTTELQNVRSKSYVSKIWERL